ncbi:cyclophilin [Trypanosoma grayi]|uniref:cyclophilin n=1 Tax=Trypanosoma grayi TaxID=71804 RepID=UPI0004F4073A|nr:cyclophilin [Trypanosoma grayi]KEG10047.1 cyclophilin [Trypanosoma grayi]
MPAKRGTKVNKFREGSGDDHLPVFSVFVEKEGQGRFGRIDIELFLHRAPKACDIFLQSCAATLGGDKKGAKRVSCKQYRFVRLTNEGLQVGERSSSRTASVSELESEVGRIYHGVGIVSLCRSSTSFDESFFFCLTDDRVEVESLDKRHVAFGRVVEGLDILLALQDALLPYVKEGCIIEGGPYTISEILPKTTL